MFRLNYFLNTFQIIKNNQFIKQNLQILQNKKKIQKKKITEQKLLHTSNDTNKLKVKLVSLPIFNTII